jgi:two-component system CheB/CheR fusion protein
MAERAHRSEIRRRRVPIVGLAASDSSLTVLTSLLGAVTAESGLCFVVAMSVDSLETDGLCHRLQQFTALPVAPACDRQPLAPGHVYVLPQRQPFVIERGIFRLNHAIADSEHGTIDPFFRSLATDPGDRAAVIVLSGSGTEGAIGMRAVKAAGGLSIAQTPESAAQPENAAAHRSDSQSILSIIRAHTGRDIRGYKPRMLWQRIERRMRVQAFSDTRRYADALHTHPSCIDRLGRTIS